MVSPVYIFKQPTTLYEDNTPTNQNSFSNDIRPRKIFFERAGGKREFSERSIVD